MTPSALTTEREREQLVSLLNDWVERGGLRTAPREQVLAIRQAITDWPTMAARMTQRGGGFQ